MITLIEDSSTSYRARTLINANNADITISFAYDFETAGEKLTKSAAGKKYIAIDKNQCHKTAAGNISWVLGLRDCATLNIAGNGIYTLAKYGVTQNLANLYVYRVIQELSQLYKIDSIRSGGQTGIDTAGLVAGIALNIDVIGLYPKGFKRRNSNGVDFLSNEEQIRKELLEMSNIILYGEA